jgi:hypothetical protein
MRDLAYELKERLGLEWQHLLPGIQRVCVIYGIKYRGKDSALEILLYQVRKLQPLLDECPKNPPQPLPLTPLYVTNIAKFDELFLGLADTFGKIPEMHPALIAHALSMLVSKLASAQYDLIFLSAILASSCTDIQQGKYDFVKKTH